MAQKRLSVWFSKAGPSGTNCYSECVVSDSEAQDSMDCSLTTETVPGSDEDSDHSDVDHGLGELAPPQRKVQKVSVRYKTGSKCGFKKDYITKHPWLVSDGTGKGAFCKFRKQFYRGSRVFLRVMMEHLFQNHSLNGAKPLVQRPKTTNY